MMCSGRILNFGFADLLHFITIFKLTTFNDLITLFQSYNKYYGQSKRYN